MLLMNIIEKRIDDNIMIMNRISYSQYLCFILSIAIKRSIADKATSFAIFDFDLSEFLLAIRTFIFASMIVMILVFVYSTTSLRLDFILIESSENLS